ncbi:MAG: DUF4386 family protein [Reichenbachiella sp.]|uniref:DUF4386 family protein n=1 Tax=Reichenbachiella sp. TaxID=2184521 RepID=UPI002966C025|nr:DUF4386 family protein [Reichenbachiella sp.]MDW3208374.1 DUF4386 family protein [Reichenbachiella sp.]
MKNSEIQFTGWMIIIHIILMLTAGIILIYTFEFPDILRENMETTLGLFYKNRSFTVPAYYLFTLTGISFMTVVLLLFKTLNFNNSTTGFLAVVFGVLFGLTSSLGFVRWPFLMQHLGELVAHASPAQLETIRVIYDSFHIYAGVSVGENFAFWFEFLWMFLFSTSMLSKPDYFPNYLARIGQVLGLGMLVYAMEQFGGMFSALGPLNMIVHTGQLAWLLALAFCLFNIATNNTRRLSRNQKLAAMGLFGLLLFVSFF